MQPVTEQELIEKAVAPRVTEVGLEASIKETYFINPREAVVATGGPDSEALGVLTICVIVLNNGFTITGESACADPKNYNKELGERLAYDAAKKKIWPFLGFVLREDLYRSGADSFAGRMVIEAKDLAGKIERLRAFIGSETYNGLDDSARHLLNEQFNGMQLYASALHQRVESLG